MTAFGQCRNTAPPVSTKQWNPGPYISSTRTNNSQIWDRAGSGPGTEGILQRFGADTDDHWRGAILRFYWGKNRNSAGTILPDDYLEDDTIGSYGPGMDRLEAYLDTLYSSFPTKRIIVFVQIKTFGSFNRAVPLYMRNGSNSAYNDPTDYGHGLYNGDYPYGSSIGGPGGYVPNMHITAVKDRFAACMTAFATRFNTHPALEAICFTEASISRPIGASASWAPRTTWLNNMTSVFTTMKPLLTNIQICQWINADRADMKDWVPDLRAAGIGLGMPDLSPEDKGCNFRNDLPGQSAVSPGNIQHCQMSNGMAIIMGHMSPGALDGPVTDRCQTSGTIQSQPHVYPAYPGVSITRQATMDFAVGTVGCTHVGIAYLEGNQPVTGTVDPLIPGACAKNPYQSVPAYSGQNYNVITDEWIHNPTSNITTITTRPTGW